MTALRRATPVDETFLLTLAARLADFPIPRWRTADEIARADYPILLDALHRPGPTTMIEIAEAHPGMPIGYVLVTTETDYFSARSHAHVEILVVVPGAEGKGVGRMLLEAAEGWARSRGYQEITLNVFARNQRALQLYERLGYEPETVHYWKALSP